MPENFSDTDNPKTAISNQDTVTGITAAKPLTSRRKALKKALTITAGAAAATSALSGVSLASAGNPVGGLATDQNKETNHPGPGTSQALPSVVGGGTTHTKTYSGTTFTSTSSANSYNYGGAGSIYRTAGSNSFDCHVELPEGAIILGAYFAFIKNSANDALFELDSGYIYTGSFTNLLSASTSGYTPSGNVTWVYVAAASPIIVSNYTAYWFRWYPGENTSASILYGATILYTYGGSVNLLPNPIRILDTRVGAPAPIAPNRKLNGGENFAVQVTGTTVGGIAVPSTATAVLGNVTALNGIGAGNLRLFPYSTTIASTSSLNFIASQALANGVTVGLNSGKMSVYVGGGLSGPAVDVLFDVTGYIL